MFGRGLLRGLGITFKHAFEPDLTIQYPEETPGLEERFRGSLVFQFEKCIACGLCIKTCPNRVLTLETIIPEGSKKKQVQSYTIDRQYCMYCNLCVEICPTSTLYFSHNFELTQLRREDIRIVYTRPAVMKSFQLPDQGGQPDAVGSGAESFPGALEIGETSSGSEDDSKRRKQIEAIKTSLAKNPAKVLAKFAEHESDLQLLVDIIHADDKKFTRLAELLADDREKAGKFALALVSRARRPNADEEGAPR